MADLDFSSNASAVDPATLDFSHAAAPVDDNTVTVTAQRGSVPEDAALGSDWQNYLAGIGKSLVDTGRGAAQAVASLGDNIYTPVAAIMRGAGLNDQADVLSKPGQLNAQLKAAQAEANARDEPLMHTKAGFAGDLSGNALQFLAPGAALKAARAAELPGALATVGEGNITRALLPETIRGSMAQGAAQGLAQPLETGQDDSQRLINAGVGTAAGAVGALIPRAIGAVARTGKALVAPFTDSGQNSIIGDLARRFGIDATAPVASQVPGVTPTLAEATGSPNAANFQRALLNQPGAQNQFAERAATNNAARYAYLRDAAGSPESIAALQDARESATSPLYNLARNIDAENRATTQGTADMLRNQGMLMPGGQGAANAAADAVANAVPAQVVPLLQRPAFQQAVKDASQLLAERGKPGMNPLTSVEGLQAIKTSLDNAINKAPTNSAATFDLNAAKGTRAALVDALQEISPQQREADQTFASMSKPINAQEVAQEILKRGTSAAENTAGVPQVREAALANAVRNADNIAASVTGRKAATAGGTLSPDQIGAFRTVLGDLARQTEAQRGSLPPGSPTVQNAVSQNLMSAIGAVPGLGKLASNGPLGTLASLFDWTLKKSGVPEKLQAKAMNLALNPGSPEAAAIRAQLTPAQRSALEATLTPYSNQALQTTRQSAQQ